MPPAAPSPAVKLMDDVTHQLRMQSQLTHAAKTEALALTTWRGVAHDFKNLLTRVILTQVELWEMSQGITADHGAVRHAAETAAVTSPAPATRLRPR